MCTLKYYTMTFYIILLGNPEKGEGKVHQCAHGLLQTSESVEMYMLSTDNGLKLNSFELHNATINEIISAFYFTYS